MQPYNLPTRKIAFAFVIVQTIIFGLILFVYHFADLVEIPVIALKAISVSVITYTIWEVFRRYLWKYKIFQTLGLVNFPNIEGKWNGFLDWEGRAAKIPVNFDISQTYTTMSVVYLGAMSTSYSLSASFVVSSNDDYRPAFQFLMTFRNERTRIPTDEELKQRNWIEHKTHRGTVVLNVEGEPPNRLVGAIWTESQTNNPSRPHETVGYMRLERAD